MSREEDINSEYWTEKAAPRSIKQIHRWKGKSVDQEP